MQAGTTAALLPSDTDPDIAVEVFVLEPGAQPLVEGYELELASDEPQGQHGAA